MLDGIKTTLAQIESILERLWAVMASIGDALAFLGLESVILLLVTFAILYLLSMTSPFERRPNFLMALALGSAFFYYVTDFALISFYKYLGVMLAPLLLGYLLQGLWWLLRWGWQRYRGKKEDEQGVVLLLLNALYLFMATGDKETLRQKLKEVERRL